jgi:hypothetical protein
MISIKEKKRRQHEKELRSFRNKMGSNIVWFDSLGKNRQYDLLFGWKRVKSMNKRVQPEYVLVNKRVPVDPKRPYGRSKIIKVLELKYPASLKHFIKECRQRRDFQPSVRNVRQATIDILLNNKTK